jgi:hypothetical protein
VRHARQETFEVYTQVVWNKRRSVGTGTAAFIDVARAAFAQPPASPAT